MDFVINLFLKEDKDSAILNYAIKIIAKKHLGVNAKSYFILQIHHLVLLYPYLIHLLDEFVFEPHKVDKSVIKKISIDIYKYGKKKKFYEANSYAIFWAIKYQFDLNNLENNFKIDSENSEDAIFLTLSYLYEKNRRKDISEYRDLAKELKIEFDRYWLFIYEVLNPNELPVEYKKMKTSKVSFIKRKFNRGSG